MLSCCFSFFNDTPTTEIYTLSLHDALPICVRQCQNGRRAPEATRILNSNRPRRDRYSTKCRSRGETRSRSFAARADRKSTRLNSSHITISYAVFCLKKKKRKQKHA